MSMTKAQLSTVLNNHSGPLSSEIFEEYFDSREFMLTHRCAISTAVDEYMVMPYAGKIVDAWSVINGAITGAPETIILKDGVGGSAIGTITITETASAAGDVDQIASVAENSFSAGDVLEIVIGGESTNGPQCDVVMVYQLA